MKDELLTELVRDPLPLFVAKWLLERRTPFLFGDDHISYIRWRAQLAKKLGVDPCSVLFIGSAAVGLSMNPNKNWKAFDGKSDIDIAIISGYFFEESWRFLRGLGATRYSLPAVEQQAIQDHRTNLIYWGTIASEKNTWSTPIWQGVVSSPERDGS